MILQVIKLHTMQARYSIGREPSLSDREFLSEYYIRLPGPALTPASLTALLHRVPAYMQKQAAAKNEFPRQRCFQKTRARELERDREVVQLELITRKN